MFVDPELKLVSIFGLTTITPEVEVTSRGVADADKIICSGHNLKYNLVKLLASLSRPNNLSFEVGCL